MASTMDHTLYIIILLPHLTGCMDIELWFSKYCIKFLRTALTSKNSVVRMISNMGINWDAFSQMCRNLRLVEFRCGMKEYNMCKI